jgi:glycosyltransferase involved in cell wall biosynthesis
VAVAGETLLSGGLAHYVTRIDEALRKYAPTAHQVISPVIERNIAAPAWANIRQTWPYRTLARAAKTMLGRRQWQQSETWAEEWRSMPSDVIVLLPHVVFVDKGALDSYYEAIASRNFVWVIHDLHGYHYPDQWESMDIELMHRRFAVLSSAATHVITHNNFTAEDVSARLGIERERISVIHLPSLVSEWPAARRPDETILADLKVRPPYAVWSSSSTFAHKNHERLLKAWRLLLERGHDMRLVCTGSKGPRYEAISALCQDLGLEAYVRFTDVIDDAALAVVVRNAHLAVCPTLFEGGGSGPASEAIMACVPVAVSLIPQVREQFGGRDDLCIYFDPLSPEAIADAVEEIINNYKEAKRRAARARTEFAALRSWRNVADAYWVAVDAAISFVPAIHRPAGKAKSTCVRKDPNGRGL